MFIELKNTIISIDDVVAFKCICEELVITLRHNNRIAILYDSAMESEKGYNELKSAIADGKG